jgi:hypothetical protein
MRMTMNSAVAQVFGVFNNPPAAASRVAAASFFLSATNVKTKTAEGRRSVLLPFMQH